MSRTNTFFILALLFFFLLPSFSETVLAAIDAKHVGFVNSSLWFDREPFFSNENVRVYTALANSTPADFNGTIEFYDGDILIGSSEVSLERNGGFEVVWADWTPHEGDHTVRVRIVDAILIPPEGEPIPVTYDEEPSSALSRFVDTDTDGDGVGNRDDTDDDNDGIPNEKDDMPLVALSLPNSTTGKEEEKDSIRSLAEDLSGQAVLQIGNVASSTMPRIVAGVETALEAIEEFRIGQNEKVDARIKTIRERIAEDRAGFEELPQSEEERKNAPWNQLELLALTAAGYTLSNRIVFYLFAAFIAYVILKTIIPWMYYKIRG